MKLEVGDVVFFNWGSPYARLIRWRNKIRWGGKGWSHCGIIAETGYLEERKTFSLIYEAVSKGFVKSYYPDWWLEEKIAEGKAMIMRPKYKLRKVKENADKYLGRDYAWTDIFFIAYYWILGKTALKSSTGAKEVICSEAIARILYDASRKKINFEKEWGIPYDFIEPMHLVNSTKFLEKKIWPKDSL